MAKKVSDKKLSQDCQKHLRAIHDTQDLLSGKWKVIIIGSLALDKSRFMDLQRMISEIGPKMLAKELEILEINGLVKRNVLSEKPLSVEYELTDYGNTLEPLINEMASWGEQHREKVKKTFRRF